MRAWIKRIHLWMGLMCCSALFVYSVAGLHATTWVRPADRPRPDAVITEIPFTVPGALDDSAAGRLIWEKLGRTMTAPPPNPRRDDDHNIGFMLYEPNGTTRVTYLEKEGKLRTETRRNGLAQFFSNLHEMTIRQQSPDLRNRLWRYYNEVSVWCLLLMVATGAYLWLASRPRLWWAWATFLAGTLGTAAFYAIGRS